MDRARHRDPAGVGGAGAAGAPGSGGPLTHRARGFSATAVVCAALACSQLEPDLDGVVALEVTVPDSGFLEAGDTLYPRARPLNGRGDSVPAPVVWGSLDTAIVAVVDSESGATWGKAPGAGRIQARVGRLRSNPILLVVQPPLDSIGAAGALRDTVFVSGPPRDTLSDSLAVRVFAPVLGGLTAAQVRVRRRLTYALTVFPAGAGTLTLIPNDTARTDANGIAVVQVRLDGGGSPDSVRVAAHAAHRDGAPVPGSPVTFVVEFRP